MFQSFSKTLFLEVKFFQLLFLRLNFMLFLVLWNGFSTPEVVQKIRSKFQNLFIRAIRYTFCLIPTILTITYTHTPLYTTKIISLQITELKHDVISVKIFNMKCLLQNPERFRPNSTCWGEHKDFSFWYTICSTLTLKRCKCKCEVNRQLLQIEKWKVTLFNPRHRHYLTYPNTIAAFSSMSHCWNPLVKSFCLHVKSYDGESFSLIMQ